ncbi:MAG: hypothetical protein JWO39_2543, partial [Gemmatimonadetes bacterium]|nr:hypothetical protein [Gemmatimonadota bacterium]
MTFRRLENFSLLILFAFISFAGGLFAVLISPAFILRDVLMQPVLSYALAIQLAPRSHRSILVPRRSSSSSSIFRDRSICC